MDNQNLFAVDIPINRKGEVETLSDSTVNRRPLALRLRARLVQPLSSEAL